MPRTWLPSVVLLLLPSLSLPAAGPPASGESTLRKLTYPGRKWSLVIDLPGFEFEGRAARDDLTGVRVFGENKKTGVLLSIYLERAERKGDAEVCRAFYWGKAKRTTPRPKDVRFTERKDLALVEYTTSRLQGVEVRQENVSAYMSHDGVWIEIRLSKDDRRAIDRVVFDKVLDSVRIVEPDMQSHSGPIVASAPSRSPEPLFFQAPGKGWGVVLDAPGAAFEMTPLYEFDKKEHEITGQRVTGRQWNGRIEKTGLVFWVALATVERDVDAKAFRDLIWEAFKRGQMVDVTRSERGGLPVLEYQVPLVESGNAYVKKTLAYLGRDRIAGIVELSKVDYRPEDAPAFDAVLSSIRVGEPTPTPP